MILLNDFTFSKIAFRTLIFFLIYSKLKTNFKLKVIQSSNFVNISKKIKVKKIVKVEPFFL